MFPWLPDLTMNFGSGSRADAGSEGVAGNSGHPRPSEGTDAHPSQETPDPRVALAA